MVKKIGENQYQCEREACAQVLPSFGSALRHQKLDNPHVVRIYLGPNENSTDADKIRDDFYTIGLTHVHKPFTPLTGHLCSREGASKDMETMKRFFHLQDVVKSGTNEIDSKRGLTRKERGS